ncbi:MAG: M13 family metallopeptidase [Acidobacteriota bacterium]
MKTKPPSFRSALLVIVMLFSTVSLSFAQNAGIDDIDRTVKPGDDFYRYANGAWLKRSAIPDGRSTFDNRAIMGESTAKRVRDLITEAAAAHPPKGSVAQKAGDYFASFTDTDSIEAKGLTPLANDMAGIAGITNKTSLSAYLGTTLNSEVDGLTANADHILGVLINQGFEDSKHNLPHLLQGGLGMPDREIYLDQSPKSGELRIAYQAHIAAILKLGGVPDAETKAAAILALEIQIARSHAPDSDSTDVFKQNNPWKRVDFASNAPGMDWEAYFRSAGLSGQSDFLVWQPTAVTGTSALITADSVDTWKDYLRFHLIEHYASVLPKNVAAEDFAFYGKTLANATQPSDRGATAITATNAALGQAVGQLYTQRYFPPEAKASAEEMAANLITAYRSRIPTLSWMSSATKQKALAKLAAFKIGLGYPDVWIDYSSYEVVRGDALGNMRRAESFNRAHDLALLKKPVKPYEWSIVPQIPGAVIMFSPNVEFFAAAILQAPYFDYKGDAASNYGSAGAGIAHEISHSFDELGNIYDAEGRLGKWWTDDDTAKYHEAASKLTSQFSSYCPLPDLCLKGDQVLSENIADIAGLRTAHDAYLLSRKGKADAAIGGLTGEQRFFIAFSQRWRRLQTEAALRRQVATDTHPPGEYRSDTVRNIDDWYKAFGIAPGDKLFLKPEDRVGIW